MLARANQRRRQGFVLVGAQVGHHNFQRGTMVGIPALGCLCPSCGGVWWGPLLQRGPCL